MDQNTGKTVDEGAAPEDAPKETLKPKGKPEKDKPEKGMTTVEAVKQLLRKDMVKLESGTEVECRLCKLRDVVAFTEFITILFQEMQVGMLGEKYDDLQSLAQAKLHDFGFILKLISNNLDKTLDMVAKLCSLTVDEMKELDIDEAVTVFIKVMEINYDFFTLKVIPSVRAAMVGKMAAKMLAAELPGKT